MSAQSPEETTELRRLLERAQPKARYDVEAGAARHRQLLAQAAPTPDWAPAVLRARRVPSPWMWSVIGGALLLGVWAWQSASSAPAQAVPSPAPHAAKAVSSAPSARPTIEPLIADAVPHVAPQPAVHRPAATAAALQVAEPTPSAVAIESARSAPLREQALPKPTRAPRRRAPAPSASTAVDAPLALELSVPSPASANDPASLQNTTPEQPVRRPSPEAIDPEVLEEMQQLATAERLLPTMPSRTLALVREGMQRFSHGYLAQERRYLEIMALLALKMPKDAELLSRGFLRDYPKGPYRRKVERALEEGARN